MFLKPHSYKLLSEFKIIEASASLGGRHKMKIARLEHEEKRYVLKKADSLKNAIFEKVGLDLLGALSVSVPQTFIVYDKNGKVFWVASELIPGIELGRAVSSYFSMRARKQQNIDYEFKTAAKYEGIRINEAFEKEYKQVLEDRGFTSKESNFNGTSEYNRYSINGLGVMLPFFLFVHDGCFIGSKSDNILLEFVRDNNNVNNSYFKPWKIDAGDCFNAFLITDVHDFLKNSLYYLLTPWPFAKRCGCADVDEKVKSSKTFRLAGYEQSIWFAYTSYNDRLTGLKKVIELKKETLRRIIMNKKLIPDDLENSKEASQIIEAQQKLVEHLLKKQKHFKSIAKQVKVFAKIETRIKKIGSNVKHLNISVDLEKEFHLLAKETAKNRVVNLSSIKKLDNKIAEKEINNSENAQPDQAQISNCWFL